MAQFNSEQFGWSNVTIQIGGRVLTAVQAVRYKISQEKGYVYGKGFQPLSIQRGNVAYEGSIKLLQSEVEVLLEAAPNQNLLDYRNLAVIVGYEKDDQAVYDTLSGVEFSEVEKAMEQGKQFMEVELPIMFLSIKKG